MSAVSFTTYNSQKLSDSLLDPLRFCGKKWNQITDIEDGNILYKAFQVAIRIIPGTLLSIATGLVILPGLLGSLICSKDPALATPWIPYVYPAPRTRSSMTVDVPTNFQTIQKCRNLGLNFIDQGTLTYKLQSQLPFGMLTIEDVTHNYAPGTNFSHFSFHLEDSKHGKLHSFSQCFLPQTDLEKAELLLQFKNVVLGLETDLVKQTEIIETTSSIFRDVTFHMANDFSKMTLQAFV